MNKNFVEGKVWEVFFHEWVLSNQLGGYALGTGNNIPTRKYHGLLISGNNQSRNHLLSSIEEKVKIGVESMFLDSSHYRDNIYPNGYRHLIKSWLLPYPGFLYSSYPFDEQILIFKYLQMDQKSNSIKIVYKNIGTLEMKFYLRYKFTFRDHHAVNVPGSISPDDLSVENSESGLIKIRSKINDMEAAVFSATGKFDPDFLIYKNIYYPTEGSRGYPCIEDLYSPFVHSFILKPGEECSVIVSSEEKFLNSRGGDLLKKLGKAIENQYSVQCFPLDYPINLQKSKGKGRKSQGMLDKIVPDEENVFSLKDLKCLVQQMLETFMLKDDVIAGYPWFNSWGRDTMIFLEALNGDYQNKKYKNFYFKVLKKYGRLMKNGIIPNVVDPDGIGSNYDTIDASLFYCLRIYDWLSIWADKQGEDKTKETELLQIIADVILNYCFNDKLPFYLDLSDGLLAIKKEENKSLTWMDARIGDLCITPRYDKPVEIQFLFYSAVSCLIELTKKYKLSGIRSGKYKTDIDYLNKIRQKTGKSLTLFFNNGHWGDRIQDGRLISEIRPNYLIGLSVPFVKLTGEQLNKGIEQAEESLLTAYGFRTLNRESPMFRKKYQGNQKMRDMVYHQGTVWAWLIMPYVKLIEKKIKSKKELKEYLAKRFEKTINGLLKGHYGSIAEIWDGDDPHDPKGTPAQAWSVAAYYYLIRKII